MDFEQPSRSVSASSLLRSIHDGTASIASRLLVSLMAGLLLLGLTCVTCYCLAALFPPPWMRGSQGRYPPNMVRVSDEVALSCFLVAAAVYLLFLVWVWSRHRRKWPIWNGVVKTLGVWLGTTVLCVALANEFSGDDEFLILGMLSVAGSITLWIWFRVYQQSVRGRPLYGQEGLIDVRCPKCQYRMVGLKEARCPECGQEYTLDELVRKQDYDVLRERSLVMATDDSLPINSPHLPENRPPVSPPPPPPPHASIS